MNILVIEDLPVTTTMASRYGAAARSLSRADMQALWGGRAISVLVDGRPGGVVDDCQLQMAIFKGDIGVTVR